MSWSNTTLLTSLLKSLRFCLKKVLVQMCLFLLSDSHGHIDNSLRPLWDLAFLGSSYVMWEKTTQVLHYYLVQLSSVERLVRTWSLAGPAEPQGAQCSGLNGWEWWPSWREFYLHFIHSANVRVTAMAQVLFYRWRRQQWTKPHLLTWIMSIIEKKKPNKELKRWICIKRWWEVPWWKT